MPGRRIQWVRTHPLRFAALLGAAFGFLHVVVSEIAGAWRHDRHGTVLMLWSASVANAAVNKTTILTAAALLFVEFAANVLVDALLFVLPVAIVVGLRRVFHTRGRSAS